jgi:hypothetical protein
MPPESTRTCTAMVKAPSRLVICAAVIHIVHTRMRFQIARLDTTPDTPPNQPAKHALSKHPA